MNPDPSPITDAHVEKARPGDRPEALALVFAHLDEDQRQRRVEEVLAQRSGLTSSIDLWVASRGHHPIAAALAQIEPGRSAHITLSRKFDDARAAAQLLRAIIADLTACGVQLAQSLLEVDHGEDADLLRAVGFRHISNLLYLVSLRSAFPTTAIADGPAFVPQSAGDTPRLARVVARTYVDSLDCPAVNEMRDVADVLDGYRANGPFDPARWLIVQADGADVGCLLLADQPRFDQWELMYIGVVPEARGHGLGLAMVRHAQWMAAQAGRQRLVLAVAADNHPAIAMYAAAGFITWDIRSIFLRPLASRSVHEAASHQSTGLDN